MKESQAHFEVCFGYQGPGRCGECVEGSRVLGAIFFFEQDLKIQIAPTLAISIVRPLEFDEHKVELIFIWVAREAEHCSMILYSLFLFIL